MSGVSQEIIIERDGQQLHFASHEELLKFHREEFLNVRAKQELEVAKFAERVEQIGRDFFRDIELPEEISLKALIPEFYNDEVRPKVYKEQWSEAQRLFKQIVEIYNKALIENESDREAFLVKRTEQEIEVNKFAEKFKKIDPAFWEGKVEVPEEISLKAMVPELYKEDSDRELCHEQWAKANEFFSKVSSIFEEMQRGARECLLEYEVLASKV